MRRIAVLVFALGAAACEPEPSTPPQPEASAEPSPSEEEEPTSTAAGAPVSDIFVAALDLKAHPPTLGEIRNLTAREGYDNQPHFVADGSAIYFTSIRSDQADPYLWKLDAAEPELVRTSPANEFSPTVMPSGDALSMIREDGGVQKLWTYALGEDGDGKAILDEVLDVGYHAWLSADDVALFIVDAEGGKHRLEHVHVPTGKRSVLAENIGRGLAPYPAAKEPTGAITYVQKGEEGEAWTIRSWTMANGESKTLCETLPGAEDYAWAPDASLLMAKGTTLHRWTEASGWTEFGSLAQPDVAQVTRLAISPDGTRLAFVGMRESLEP